MAAQEETDKLWFLKAKCPVFLPKLDALTLSSAEFGARLTDILKPKPESAAESVMENVATHDNESFTIVSEQPSTAAEARDKLQGLAITDPAIADTPVTAILTTDDAQTGHPFMDGLTSYSQEPAPDVNMENKMFTDNGDLTYMSTTHALVDLFFELEDVITGPRLHDLLNAAWKEDPLATLKIIFNSRSIHLGKSSRLTFYRCAGWIAQYHPRTLVTNIQWLSRPVIPKKVDEDEENLVIIPSEVDSNDPTRFDLKTGVSHGYWKDLLNILALSANKKLSVLANPRDILNIEREANAAAVECSEAKEKREAVRASRHESALRRLQEDPVHLALHLTVARLFAEQLAADLALLRGDDKTAKKYISLCAKWAPSTARFHDKHTFVVSSIAEILYPEDHFVQKGIISPLKTDVDRTVYLRHARDALRKDVAALRKHLEVVERDITTETFNKIKYERVPSLAMRNYSGLFATKDTDRFEKYLDKVASGKARISGATLLPSTLIKAVRVGAHGYRHVQGKKRARGMLQSRLVDMDAKVIDGQWNALVQRIKDSGTMDSCIAVCDVSGSMLSPSFTDQTCPMDSAIGLSLLIAEVTQPPFHGSFITFSERPAVQTVDLSKGLKEKYRRLANSSWGMSTNFEAVFTKLILPMAVDNKLAQEQMVKRIFVFSDMQFDQAGETRDAWSTSYERIKKAYAEAGYEVPEMIFWNLAGGRGGIAPKPVTAEDEGVAMVSGYSQGMLKVFLDKGLFEEEEEEEIVDVEGGQELVEVEKKVKKARVDPLSTMRKAISHKAYAMLEVVD